MENSTFSLDRASLKPFLSGALVWLALGSILCLLFAHPSTSPSNCIKCMMLLWAVCVFDLYALARVGEAAFALMSFDREKRGALLIQASYWGVIKLACLGIIGTILLKGRSLPALGLILGSATLVVVPLLGGYWWSQKVLSHA